MADAPTTAEARRRARADWTARVVRPGEAEVEADADADFWMELSPSERVALAWSLSRDLYDADHDAEPRLSRSAARVRRL